MKRKQLFLLLLIATLARIIWCVAGWKTEIIESYENNISIVYQRNAYLLAFGYGYRQTAPDSPASESLTEQMNHIKNGSDYVTSIDTNGIRNFEQYPPGWSLVAAGLFKITKIPIPYLMQITAVIADVTALFLLIQVCLLFVSRRTVIAAGYFYALYPPVLAITSLMTPDSWMLFFIACLLYTYFFHYKSRPIYSLIIMGVITGIGILFRSDFAFIAGFITIGNLLKTKKWDFFLRNNLIIYSITFLILLPWGLYNLKENGHFTIFSTALGGTLVTGFAAYDDPLGLGPSDLDRLAEAQQVGIDAPFEYEGDIYFRNKFIEYISDYPGFYAKSIALRSIEFSLPAYSWGVELDSGMAYSEIRNNGSFRDNIPEIIQHYGLNLFSALLALAGNLAIIVLLFRKKNNELFLVIALTGLCIYLSHVFIHMTPSYAIPLIFFQILAFFELLISKRKSQNG